MPSPRDASDVIHPFLIEWHRIVAEKDLAALPTVLADDVSLGAPPYWEKLRGRALVAHLLGLIVRTIEDFTYHREWQQGRQQDTQRGDELALEFSGHVGDLDLQGIDLITLTAGPQNANRQIQNLDVLIRPINAVHALRDIVAPEMANFLAQQAGNR